MSDTEQKQEIRRMAAQIAAGLLANPCCIGPNDPPSWLADNTNALASKVADAAVRVAWEIWERT